MYGFDTDPVAREKCAAMANLNGMAGRVHVRGTCDPAALSQLLTPGSLLLSDCEGYEFEPLDPARVPTLARTAVIVELHEHTRPGLTAANVDRFRDTHHARMVEPAPRAAADSPCLEQLSEADWVLALDEMRLFPQRWAYLTPIGDPAPPA